MELVLGENGLETNQTNHRIHIQLSYYIRSEGEDILAKHVCTVRGKGNVNFIMNRKQVSYFTSAAENIMRNGKGRRGEIRNTVSSFI